MTNPQLFVITGGPGAGKTTILEELAKLGYGYAPEVAREIIREQMKTGGSALPWADREAYTELMLRRSIESFRAHAAASQAMFSDRGIPDTLCYARLIGLRDTAAIETACQQYRYAETIFLAPPWEEIYSTDSERKQDFAEAERTYRLMREVYGECGYECIEIPRGAPTVRAEFVVQHVLRRGLA